MSYRKYLMTDDVPPSELYKTVKIDTDSDTISRAKAIDGKICVQRSNGVEIYDDYVVPVEYLEQLPPAQPEPSQVSKDITRIVENEQDMRVIGQERIRGRWIPVGGALYKCDQCGVVSLKRKFCSECGADMRGVTE